ncbi:amidase family protein [Actinotignum urinale]|uniref:amidase family protein n=1 Tax=Actinotignum urinale TaxID=190146 RepID=UPI002A83A557|nr:amidase family protein [Actinotignum urinale]MDY5151321.1 amidase family protein [Actinotignum urinale]
MTTQYPHIHRKNATFTGRDVEGDSLDLGAVDLAKAVRHGVLARTVEDLRAGFSIIAGTRPGDWYPQVSWQMLQELFNSADINSAFFDGLKIAVLTESLNVETDIHPASFAAVERAKALFREVEARLLTAPAPITHKDWLAFMPIWQVGAASIPVSDEEKLTTMSRWLRAKGRELSGKDVIMAQGAVQKIARTMGQAFEEYDVVLTPSLGTPPAHPEWVRLPENPEEDFRRQCAVSPWTSSWNIFGPVAITVPLHREKIDGITLPFGIHLAGTRPGQEALLLKMAEYLEKVDPWPHITVPTKGKGVAPSS